MFTVIFGRPGCPYCVRAKELAEKLTNERDDFNYRYVDIHAEGISKADWKKPLANRLKPCRRFSSTRNTSAAAPILKPGQRESRPVCLSQFICSMNDCAGYQAEAQINKSTMPKRAPEHGAQHHAISCQNVRWVTKNKAASSPCRPAPPVSRQRTQHPPSGERDSSPPPLAAKEEQAQLRVAAGAKCPFHM